MKKKLVTIVVVITIIVIVLFGFWSKNYLTALWYFKSDNPQRHKLAFSYLKEIPGSVTIKLFERMGDELQKEIYKDYQNLKREELINRYSNTLIAYIDADFNVCFRNFDGSKIKKIQFPRYSISFDSMLTWAKDGSSVYIVTDSYVNYFLDTRGFKIRESTSENKYRYADWSPDNTKLVLNNGPDLHVLNVSNLKLRNIYSKDFSAERDSPYRYSAFYPIWIDNTNILFSIKNNLEIINSETKERQIIHTNKDANMFAMASFTTENFTFGMKALSYSGKLVAMEGGSILNLDDTSIVNKGFNDFPSWAPDDKYIMFHHLGVDAYNPEGIQITHYDDKLFDINIYMGPGRAPAWSPPLDNYDEIVAQMDDNEIDFNFELEEPLF